MPQWPADRIDVHEYPEPGADLTVFYNDLDTNGHLNNVALGRFFEQSRFAAHHAAGLPAATRAAGSRVLVARVAIDYLREGRYGHPLHVRTRVGRLGSSSVTLEQAAWQDGVPIGLAEVVLVHIQSDAPAPMDDGVRAVFASLRQP